MFSTCISARTHAHTSDHGLFQPITSNPTVVYGLTGVKNAFVKGLSLHFQLQLNTLRILRPHRSKPKGLKSGERGPMRCWALPWNLRVCGHFSPCLVWGTHSWSFFKAFGICPVHNTCSKVSQINIPECADTFQCASVRKASHQLQTEACTMYGTVHHRQ